MTLYECPGENGLKLSPFKTVGKGRVASPQCISNDLNWKLWYATNFVSGRHKYTAKNFRRVYGKITGNQLPVHFPFFTGARKQFQESGTER